MSLSMFPFFSGQVRLIKHNNDVTTDYSVLSTLYAHIR